MKKTWLGLLGAALLCVALMPFLNQTTGYSGNACAKRAIEAFEQMEREKEMNTQLGMDAGMSTGMSTEAEMTTEAVYHRITQAEAKARMDSGDELVILDVRRMDEYNAGHIKGAVLLPNEEIGTEMPDILPDKDAEILVYCRSGNRSAQAAKKLVAMGYTAVYDFGGINDWTYGTVAG